MNALDSARYSTAAFPENSERSARVSISNPGRSRARRYDPQYPERQSIDRNGPPERVEGIARSLACLFLRYHTISARTLPLIHVGPSFIHASAFGVKVKVKSCFSRPCGSLNTLVSTPRLVNSIVGFRATGPTRTRAFEVSGGFVSCARAGGANTMATTVHTAAIRAICGDTDNGVTTSRLSSVRFSPV